MEQRVLGGELVVSAIGYGAMGLAGTWGDVGEEHALAVLGRALDRGVTLIDTSDAYGAGSNEQLVGRAIQGRRDGVVVATKWGISPGEHSTPAAIRWDLRIPVDGRPERAREAAEASMRRLGVTAIDLWYLHFPDPSREIEDTVGAMAELVRDGHVRHLGLSNVTADQLRRAHAVHPITAVQYEYSLWTRTVERELLPAARELGVGLVAWSPLGSGFLAGSVDFDGEHNYRSHSPRFEGENLKENLDRFAPFRGIAAELGVTPAQLALAWLLHQGADIVPIPGTRSVEHLDANLGAAEIELDRDVLARIDELVPVGLGAGEPMMG
jgi:aryl-alcohol dehydrogenase-like predicted oxidoreductase